jgi:hypothetical protein
METHPLFFIVIGALAGYYGYFTWEVVKSYIDS